MNGLSPSLRALISYAYVNENTLGALHAVTARHPDAEILMDSGAFTAWRSGKNITLDAYCRFLEKCPVKLWRYFALDVIGDQAGTLKNYWEMRRRSFNPIPIFTRGSDPKILDEYYNDSDVVAIGGLVGTRQNRAYVNGIMRHVAGRKVHLLGFTYIDWLKHYRPYSADASSWSYGARHSYVPFYMGRGIIKWMRRRHLLAAPPPEIQESCRQAGIEWAELRKPASWHGNDALSRQIGTMTYIRLSRDIARCLGVRLFLAAGDVKSIAEMSAAHAYCELRGVI